MGSVLGVESWRTHSTSLELFQDRFERRYCCIIFSGYLFFDNTIVLPSSRSYKTFFRTQTLIMQYPSWIPQRPLNLSFPLSATPPLPDPPFTKSPQEVPNPTSPSSIRTSHTQPSSPRSRHRYPAPKRHHLTPLPLLAVLPAISAAVINKQLSAPHPVTNTTHVCISIHASHSPPGPALHARDMQQACRRGDCVVGG